MPTTRTPVLGARRRLVLLAATGLLAGGGTTALALAATDQAHPPPQPSAAAPAAPGTASPPVPSGAPPSSPGAGAAPSGRLPASPPTELDIPSIHVRTPLLGLGLNGDGTVQVPDQPLEAGWYTGSVTPGQVGASVILGHVDSARTGPAVFYRLGALRTGDQVTVTLADGSTAVFGIDTVREYPKNAFPTLTVYGTDDNLPHLRLITCGDWDPATHSYRGNTVAFATLTAHRP
ncbi:class F sortase [Kitasatospora cineracea]|uniref:LPXTG-site transpeptidase (Sortase) family protein n=1 Tax=Kitasatospora cineracea TaxID=88074 RepID=A0A8G1UM76_9ACTN|nr:class F sortase [Kitasatospora cineracea]ROR46380.1 LPXTG-site transpeptidase (sortase) family protein [Kitasatospora cineracea]